MPASIGSVVSMGFGSWGSVNLLPTLGYGIQEVVSVVDSANVRRGQVGTYGMLRGEVGRQDEGQTGTVGTARGDIG